MTGIVTDELLIDKVFRICGSIIINNYLPNSDFIKLLSTSHNLYNILIHMAFKKIEFPLECVLKLKDHKLEQYRTNIRNIIISINSPNERLSEQSVIKRFHKSLIFLSTMMPGLRNLRFANDFNQDLPINILPHNLSSLTFGDKFNRPIDINTLPSGLTSLKFGRDFDQRLKEYSAKQFKNIRIWTRI